MLKTIEGVVDIVAMPLLATLPKLGSLDRRKIASLAELAPHPNESSTKIGYRYVHGGQKTVKPVVYMAAMAALHSKGSLGIFYRKLVAASKKKMVALTALMRKIIVIANTKIRDLHSINPILTT